MELNGHSCTLSQLVSSCQKGFLTIPCFFLFHSSAVVHPWSHEPQEHDLESLQQHHPEMRFEKLTGHYDPFTVRRQVQPWEQAVSLEPYLSPPQRPLCIAGRLLCCGEAGEKEKESARGTPARFLFLSINDILMGIPSGSLCGGERSHIIIQNLTVHR